MQIIAETERQSRFLRMLLVRPIIQTVLLNVPLGNVTPVMFNPVMLVFQNIRIVIFVLQDIRLQTLGAVMQ